MPDVSARRPDRASNPESLPDFLANTVVLPDNKDRSVYHGHLSKDYSLSKIKEEELPGCEKMFELVEEVEGQGWDGLANKYGAQLQAKFGFRRSVGGFLIIEGLNTQNQKISTTKKEEITKSTADMFESKK